MRALKARRPSPALVIAIIALIAAVAGTAYAAGKIGTRQLKNGAVTARKIRNGAVTTPKLTPSERSEGFSKTTLGGGGTTLGDNDTTVVSLSLPAGGHYLVTAQTGIGGNGANETAAVCTLRNNGTDIAVGGGTAGVSGQLSGGVTLTGAAGGGTVTLDCSRAVAQTTISKNQVITAVRVGSLNTQ